MSDTDEPAALRAQVEKRQRQLWPRTDIVPLRSPRPVTGKRVR